MVATSQPLAAYHAIRVLEDGGNAVDAAVTASILLGVLEPMQIGLGGDVMALVYNSADGRLHALNASGRAGAAASVDRIAADCEPGAQHIPPHHVHAVSVPGAVDGWLTLLQAFGTIDRVRAFAPAIAAARAGFSVAPQTAATWEMGAAILKKIGHEASLQTWLSATGAAPSAGQCMRLPRLADSLAQLAEGGREVFYDGPLAAAIVETVAALGGVLQLSDFKNHKSDWVTPIATSYRDYRILQLPPNGQGVSVLQAMALLNGVDMASWGHGSVEATHWQIEAVKAAMADAQAHIADADALRVSTGWFLDESRLSAIRSQISHASVGAANRLEGGGDTAFVCVADAAGNFAAVIGSLFIPWASGITAGHTGILLQNRGHGFSLDPAHPNCIAGNKRPRHTILPAMLFRDDLPVMAFGFVGGDMQVQAQVQFLCNLIDFEMNPQEALDAPRWRYEGTGAAVALESPLMAKLRDGLTARGHELVGSGGFFGGGQAVLWHRTLQSLQGVSDGRRDGLALGL